MNYDAIIIGAGIGGLYCAISLAKKGRKVLILEKIHHIGGTSHIFKRGDYIFPMGPLSFSFPRLVNKMLREIGFSEPLDFSRSHFQLNSPNIDIVYSKPWEDFLKTLISQYPAEEKGLMNVFYKLKEIRDLSHDIHTWHPDYLIGEKKEKALRDLKLYQKEYELVKQYNNQSSQEFLEEHLSDDTLIRLMGSQGTYQPVMSLLHLAFMWNVMSFEGIWFPKIGIHGINKRISELFTDYGGQIKLNEAAEEILIDDNRIKGVRSIKGKTYNSDWVISNVDYKKTFLNLIKPNHLKKDLITKIKQTPYTGSEFCVYLGIDPEKVDLSNFRAPHLFFRHEITDPSTSSDNFFNKEIEVCLWSQKSEEFAPDEKKSIILRTNMPYDYFSKWRIAEKKRREGYYPYKKELAEKLIATVEHIVPGLSNAINTIEIATPLTYRDWGQRHKGSVAGWSRDIEKVYEMKSKLLVRSPIEGLLLVGIYSVLEPFLGGYPVSMYTGKLAAEYILAQD